MFEKAQAEHGNLGVALQAYLRRSAVDLDRVIAAGGHVRICKGAYAEGSDVAFTSKLAVDRSFDDLTRMAMEHTASTRRSHPTTTTRSSSPSAKRSGGVDRGSSSCSTAADEEAGRAARRRPSGPGLRSLRSCLVSLPHPPSRGTADQPLVLPARRVRQVSDAPYSRSAEVYDLFYESMLDYPALALAAHGMIQGEAARSEDPARGRLRHGPLPEGDVGLVRRDRARHLARNAGGSSAAGSRGAVTEGAMADFDLGMKFDVEACCVQFDRLHPHAGATPGSARLLRPAPSRRRRADRRAGSAPTAGNRTSSLPRLPSTSLWR